MAGTSTSSVVLIISVVVIGLLLLAIIILLSLIIARRQSRTKTRQLENDFNAYNENRYQVRTLSLERKKNTLPRVTPPPLHVQKEAPPLYMNYHPRRTDMEPDVVETQTQTQVQTLKATQRESSHYATVSGDCADVTDDYTYAVVSKIPATWTKRESKVDSMRSSIGVDLGGQYEKAYQIVQL